MSAWGRLLPGPGPALRMLLLAGVVTVVSGCSIFETTRDRETYIIASVYSHHTYTVGARNAPIGVFISRGVDSTWEHVGAPNVKAWSTSIAYAGRSPYLVLCSGSGYHLSLGPREWSTPTDWRVSDVLTVYHDSSRRRIVLGTASGILYGEGSVMPKWRRVSGLGATSYVTAFHEVRHPERVLFAATETGVLRSTDLGSSWSRSGCEGRAVKCLASADTSVLLAGTEDHGVYRSTDNGSTWEQLPSTAGLTVYALDLEHADGEQAWYAGTFEQGVLRSTDGGATWTCIGLAGMIVHDLLRVEDRLYAATIGSGVHLYEDGEWRSLGLSTARVWSLTAFEAPRGWMDPPHNWWEERK